MCFVCLDSCNKCMTWWEEKTSLRLPDLARGSGKSPFSKYPGTQIPEQCIGIFKVSNEWQKKIWLARLRSRIPEKGFKKFEFLWLRIVAARRVFITEWPSLDESKLRQVLHSQAAIASQSRTRHWLCLAWLLLATLMPAHIPQNDLPCSRWSRHIKK